MNFELLDILVAGSMTMKSLILLLPTHTLSDNDVNAKLNIDKIMAKHPNYLKNHEINNLVNFIFIDNFKTDPHLNPNNLDYLFELKVVKETFSAYCFKSLDEIKENHQFVSDVYSRIGAYVIQLLRIRSIVDPEYKISVNSHNVSNYDYLIVKSYWINDEGKKERKFSKLIGRSDEFPGGKMGEKAQEVGLTKIQEVMFAHYKEIYV